MPKSPAYQRIKSAILTSIHQGEWVVGQAIPTEMALAEQFGVSRMTVNRALKELTDEQVLVRVQGSGTFVAQRHFTHSFVKVRDIADDIIQAGGVHRAQIVARRQMDFSALDDEIAMRFQMGAKDSDTSLPNRVFLVRIIHFHNNTIQQFEERWVNADLVPNFLAQDFTSINTSEYLLNSLPLEGGKYEISATLADSTIADMLQIAQGAPVLLLVRHTISMGKVAIVSKFWHAGERYQFKGSL